LRFAVGIAGYTLSGLAYEVGLQVNAPQILSGNNSIDFITNSAMLLGGAITSGNVERYAATQNDCYGNNQIGWTHEDMHTYQGQELGPLYVPAAAVSLAAGLLSDGNAHGALPRPIRARAEL
jgi:hypothetical protein